VSPEEFAVIVVAQDCSWLSSTGIWTAKCW